MRMMMRITVPVEKGNQAVADGTLGTTLEALLAKTRPEAAYFSAPDGKRGGWIVFDLKDVADLPSICEPLYAGLDVSLEIFPVMTPEDVARGMAAAAA